MRRFSFGVARTLALAIPCALALVAAAASPARAISAPDARASCDRFGVLNPFRSEGATACVRVGPGNYNVTFGAPFVGPGIGRCTVTGTLGVASALFDAAPPTPGTIFLSFLPAPFPGGPQRTVKVYTFDSSGARADNGFRLLVSC